VLSVVVVLALLIAPSPAKLAPTLSPARHLIRVRKESRSQFRRSV
jgi:hypothetical protein